jgi:hypothetical protein
MAVMGIQGYDVSQIPLPDAAQQFLSMPNFQMPSLQEVMQSIPEEV